MYWDDVELGGSEEIGNWTFTEEAIIEFASKYDPQPFHTDPVAAKSHEFGGIVASGFHVSSVWMKLMIARREKILKDNPPEQEADAPKATTGVSPGFVKMRWHKPVRPGDTITFTNTIWRRVPMGKRTDIGIIQSKNVGINQHGEQVFSFIGQGLYPRRQA